MILHPGYKNEARRSAEALGLDFRSYLVERPTELENAFAAMTKDRIGVLFLDAAHPIPTNWPRDVNSCSRAA